MFNNFIGGGQIFLHKLRMFFQVLDRSFVVSLLLSAAITAAISYPQVSKYDWPSALTYQKALTAGGFDNAVSGIKAIVNPSGGEHVTTITAASKNGLYRRNIDPLVILGDSQFKNAHKSVITFLEIRLLIWLGILSTLFILIFAVWSKFGRAIKEKKHLSGHTIKTSKGTVKLFRTVKRWLIIVRV